MSDFGHFGGAEEEYAVIRKLNAEVEANPDSFESWENLVKATESLEGGLNRNASPQALATFRDSYDRFLLKFPLLFGYWRKYAETEFTIAGPESAIMVYERGIANIAHSVDLWTEYCGFKMETTHEPHLVRELFERGAALVGLDFLAHPFWDKYIEYEERQEAQDRVYEILSRLVRIPMHQYARYYERFRTMSHAIPLAEMAPADVVARFREEVEAEAVAYGGVQRAELEVERDIRAKVDNMYYDLFLVTQAEVTKRWTYESEIKRPYFHITELENTQINNWRKYLDFEESEGDNARITCLYERCLVTCALYDEFWFRYARWMSGQPGKEEEVRNIYTRASDVFVPVSRPGIRLQWAYFEETSDRANVAVDIHEAVLSGVPDCIEVIVSWANTLRRQHGLEAAVQVFRDQIDTPTVDLYTKAALVAEWAYLLWKSKRSAEEARGIFLKNVQWYADSRIFWERWFQFELQQPSDNPDLEERVQHVFEELRSKSRLSAGVKRELTTQYLEFLVQCGTKNAMNNFLQVDREMFGPPSVAMIAGSAGTKENGAGRGELDEASRAKAEARPFAFYQLNGEPLPATQGTADFN